EERIAAALASLRAERAAAEAARAAKEAEYLGAAAAGTPRGGNSPAGVAVRLAAMKVERARAAQQAKGDAWHARAAAGTPPGGPPPADPDSYRRARQAAAQREKAQARAGQAERKAAEKAARRRGPGEPVRNITDPDSRRMPVHGGGFIQGYNTQNVTSADELIIATQPTQATTRDPRFRPALHHAAAPARHPPAH